MMILDPDNPDHLNAVSDFMAALFPEACGTGSFASILRERALMIDRDEWALHTLYSQLGANKRLPDNVVEFRR